MVDTVPDNRQFSAITHPARVRMNEVFARESDEYTADGVSEHCGDGGDDAAGAPLRVIASVLKAAVEASIAKEQKQLRQEEITARRKLIHKLVHCHAMILG